MRKWLSHFAVRKVIRQMAGRPIPEFIHQHFVQKEKVENSSNRYYYACKHCQKTIEHRDSRLLLHIKNPTECCNISPEVRRQANILLADKAGVNTETKVLEIISESQANFKLKKRKSVSSPLESFMERELSQDVVNDISLKCLRYEILGALCIQND